MASHRFCCSFRELALRSIRFSVRIVICLLVCTLTGIANGDEPEKVNRRFISVDLQSVANKKLDDDFHTLPGNNLKLLPRGKQKMGDVEFVIGDKFVQLAGKRAPDYPEKIENIVVGREVTKLHVLHGAGWVVSDGTPVGEYVIHYADQTSVKIPIEYGRDVRDWWMYEFDQDPTSRAVIAWTGMNHASKNFRDQRIAIRLYRFTWENPHPEKKVASFDYVSRNDTICSPFLIAAAGESTGKEESLPAATPLVKTTPKSSKPVVIAAPTSAEDLASIEGLRDVGALLEFDDQRRLTAIALSGPGPKQGLPRGTNQTVALVARFISLEKLDLNESSVTDEGLAAVEKLSNLRWLSLNSTRITNEGLHHLVSLKSLERLRLHETPVTDEGLANLIPLANLKVLDLSKTEITDDGIAKLDALKSLEELDLRKTRVTDAGVAALQKALPNLKIAH